MIIWALIVLLVPIAIVVYAIVDNLKELIVLALMLSIFALVPIIQGVANIQAVSVYQDQAEYLSEYVPDDPIENAALTNKRVELNDWLFKAQWSREKFGIFSLYPAEVLDLEPIK